jgi:hypothetical protein
MSATTYVIHDSTGKIISFGECDGSAVQLQAVPQGCTLLEGVKGHWDTHYVNNNAVVDKPTRPSSNHVFDYATKSWQPDATYALAQVRSLRNSLIAQTDWTQLSDIPAETKALWEPYRQALRDVTNQPDPFNIVWPTPPQ